MPGSVATVYPYHTIMIVPPIPGGLRTVTNQFLSVDGEGSGCVLWALVCLAVC